MQYTSHNLLNSRGQDELIRMIQYAKTPDHEDYKNQLRIEALELNDKALNSSLEALTNAWSHGTLPKQKSQHEAYLRHWKQLILNLARCTGTNKWLGIAGDKNAYKDGQYMGLAYRATDNILKELVARGWVEKQQGAKYENAPRVNHYYPSYELKHHLAPFALMTASQSHTVKDLLAINEPDPQYEGFLWQPDHPDYMWLAEYNEFASDYNWVNKGPIRQTFKHTPFQSGRVITAFQNIPNRNFKIRTNTLINGDPIVEVDCNANHLRLYLAMHKRDVIGEDAYQPIVEASGVERQHVKAFINIALNSKSCDAAKKAAVKHYSVPFHDSDKIMDAFASIYPGLPLLGDFSLTAMQLEGMIMKGIMQQAMKDKVFVLPIHDAVACQLTSVSWAREALMENWLRVLKQHYKGASLTIK